MANFEAGDVVTLKSGGEKMTVLKDNGDGSYNCIWQKNGQTMDADYPGAVLRKYEAKIYFSSEPKRNNSY